MATISYISDDARILANDWLATLTERLVREMQAEGIADPLGERVMLAAVVANLHRLAGAPLPHEIQERIG